MILEKISIVLNMRSDTKIEHSCYFVATIYDLFNVLRITFKNAMKSSRKALKQT